MLYLSSAEYKNLRGPFKCIIVNDTCIQKRRVLVVKIDPVLNGFDYGIGLCEIKYLLLLAKYKDSDFSKLEKKIIDVVVIVPEDQDNPLNSLKPWSKMLSIGWAELYNRNRV